MLKIGLTGGIGSGKSTIAKIFSTLGVPVYDADRAAKVLMNTDSQIREKIIANFGKEAYKNNELNPAYIASIVFANKQKLRTLNDITHPATIQHASTWFGLQKGPFALKEAALIFESGSEIFLDAVIGVWAPESIRIKRVLQREGNHITERQVKDRIAGQMNEQEKMKRCNFAIDNSGNTSVLIQVHQLYSHFTSLKKK